MKNVLRVLARDVRRLFKSPATLAVVAVLIVLPSLYTWFNVVGFWDPYGNTGNLRVCVVNEDEGASTDVIGDLHLGDQIVDELGSNTQLGWTFTDYDTAMQEVQSGKAYAAFVIPEDFSYDFTTLITDDIQQPKLEYYVNEKAGAVSPKITDTGATTLDQTINSTFVSVASSTVADVIDSALSSTKGDLEKSQDDVTTQLQKAQDSIGEARTSVAALGDTTNGAIGKTDDAKATLQQAKESIELLSGQLQQVSDLTATAQDKLGLYSSSLIGSMDQGSILASQGASKANTAIGTDAGVISKANGDVQGALESAQTIASQNDAVVTQLQTLAASLPDGDQKDEAERIASDLSAKNDTLKQTISDMSQVAQDTDDAASAVAGASDSVNTAVQGTLDATDGYRSTVSSSTLPAINSALSQISGTSGSLSGAVSNQALLVDQASLVVDQLSSTLQSTAAALAQTDSLLANLQSSVDTVKTDLSALGTSDALSQMFGGKTIDASTIADFMSSPTEIRTESLYPLEDYGSGMAPLFTNLSLWIGVFMLMVILRIEVDDEGIKGLTIGQRYWARWLFLAPIAALQAIVCCTGNLIIGVQSASVPLYYVTCIIASLTYLSIQYALSLTLQHIGKGICVILVFAQIPGATGLYPIEMTPAFFQAVYPFFPFTYGINAMRETIAGFYDGQWLGLMGMLMVFMVVSFVIGLLVRPYLTNVNRLFARQIKESDIMNGEDVQVPARRYRLGQLIKALSDRDEYRSNLKQRAERFLVHYPRLKRGAWIFGIIVPTVATVVLSMVGVEKVVVLTMWLTWLIVVLMFLVVVEHMRDSFNRQVALGEADDEEVRTLFMARNGLDEPPASEGGRRS